MKLDNEENVDINYDLIVQKIKNHENVKSDRQFAFAIGMRPDSYANTKKRGNFPYEKVIDYCFRKKLSIDYIFGNTDFKSIEKIDEVEILDDSSKYIELDCIDYNETIKIPKISNNTNYKSLKAFVDKDIFIVDTSINELENNNSFLVKNNSNYFIKSVEIDFDGNYKLKESDKDDIILSIDNLDKVEVVGRIEEIYKRNILNI